MSTRSAAARMRRAVIAITLAAVPATASAQANPDASTIVASYVKAIGGRDALAKVQSMHMKGTFAMPALGAGGAVEIFSARPSNTFMQITIDGLGEILRGTNGTVAWSLDPFQGPQVMTGEALAAALADADFDAQLRDAANYTSMETVGRTTMDGQECYNVKFTHKDGRVTTDCFNVETGLLIASVQKQPSPQGDIDIVSTMRAYKPFAGVMVPTELIVNAAGQEQVITISSVDTNNVPATKFELPAAIKALVK